MARGGKREGAGRPVVRYEDKAELVLNNLLIPAFREAILFGDIYLGLVDIKDAYGVQGFADWSTWFEMIDKGHGINAGGVPTKWRLKLKLSVAAKKLFSSVTDKYMPFPSEAIRQVQNLNAYKAFWKEHQKCAEEIGAELGTSVRAPQPYNPNTNYIKIKTEIKDKAPRRQTTDGTKGYSELLVPGPDNGFTGPVTSADLSDIENFIL